MAQWIEHRIPVPRVGGSSPFWRTKNGVSHPGYTVFVFQIKGTRKFKCNSPVDCCLPPARRRQHLSVTSPFWRTLYNTQTGLESPWESPFLFQTRPVGVWMEWKHLVSGVSLWGCTVFVFSIKGTRTIKCNSPVDCCLPPARRRQHLSVTSPFWRTATPKRKGGTRNGGSSVCSGLRL